MHVLNTTFDNVKEDKLLELLEHIGLVGKYIRLIKNLYWLQTVNIAH